MAKNLQNSDFLSIFALAFRSRLFSALFAHLICVNQTGETESRENRIGGISEASRMRYLLNQQPIWEE